MLLDQGMDTGRFSNEKASQSLQTTPRKSCFPKLAEAGSTLLLSVLPEWLEKRREPTPQDETTATLCQLIEREDGKVFWNDNAETIYNRYRALSSWPGIFSFWRRNGSLLRVKLHRVSLQKQSPEIHHELGQVFEIGDRVGIQTARGIILLDEVQLEGKERVDIADFIRGYPDFIGAILE
jgi:methionyl-tRNA formyltransferase